MADGVRVAVAIATSQGVWVFPGRDDEDEWAPMLLEGRADPALGWDERERVALGLVHARFSRFVPAMDLHAVSDLAVGGASTAETTIFCAFTHLVDPPSDPALDLVAADEIADLAANARDPAVAIALMHVELHGLRGGANSPFSEPTSPPGRDRALVLLHERPTSDGEQWSARFACEVANGPKPVRGPQQATAEEAVAWGRAHADAVLLFVGDRPGEPYNAGDEPVDDPFEGTPWPPLPPLSHLAPRPVRPEHVVRYVPLNPVDPRTPE
jgi:hypothetical protein